MPLFARWRTERERQRRAALYVEFVMSEPPEADVAWLADIATGGDLDHALWELRYVRRSLGLLAAERDALDDRTGSTVARVLAERMAIDPAVAPDMRETAALQFNARLREYRDIIASRPGAPVGQRLGRMLLAFAGGPIGIGHAAVDRAGAIVARYLAEANDRLRDAYGTAALPDDVAPSAMPTR